MLEGKISAFNSRSTTGFAGVFLSGARLREVAVVLLYLGIGSSMAELASDGWTAPVGPGGFFFDDTFVFVTVAGFNHV